MNPAGKDWEFKPIKLLILTWSLNFSFQHTLIPFIQNKNTLQRLARPALKAKDQGLQTTTNKPGK
jgi:hypothetical protein